MKPNQSFQGNTKPYKSYKLYTYLEPKQNLTNAYQTLPISTHPNQTLPKCTKLYNIH